MKEEEKTDYSPDYKWLMDSHGFNEDEFNNLVNDYRFALTHLYDYLDDDDTIDAVYSGRAQFSPYMYSLLKNRGYGGMKMRDLTPEHWRNIHSDYMKDYDEFHKTHENWEPFEPDKTGYLSTAYQQSAPTQAALPQADAPIPTAEPEIVQPRQINVEAPQPVVAPKQQTTRFTDYAKKKAKSASKNTNVRYASPSVTSTEVIPPPTVDTQNAIGSLATMLGPTPEERREMEVKALKDKSKMQAWAGLFDGLRQLGNLYAVSRGAKPQQFTDNPYQQIEANYQADRQRAKDLEDYRRQYAQQLYNIRRQSEQDQIQREAHKANMEYKKAQEDSLRSKALREEEKNQATVKRLNALENKDFYQAAYWKAKAEGYPDELAAKIALQESQATENYQQGNAAMIKANKQTGGKKPIDGYKKSGNSNKEKGNTTNKGKAY